MTQAIKNLVQLCPETSEGEYFLKPKYRWHYNPHEELLSESEQGEKSEKEQKVLYKAFKKAKKHCLFSLVY